MRLNNIVKVFVCPCSKLGSVVRKSRTTASLTSSPNFELLENVKYPCALTISEKLNDKCKEYTSKLVIQTCDDWMDEGYNAFLCETADGERILIGTSERPYPTASMEQKHPQQGNESQLTEVTIQWITGKMPPKIVD